MKTCGLCKKNFPDSNFYKRGGKRVGEHYSYCKKCYYVKYIYQRWIKIKKEAVVYKGDQCKDCLGQFHLSVYDFHHRDPSIKDNDWAHIRKRSRAKRQIELDKCDLLCANCHRLRHATEFDNAQKALDKPE